MTEMVFDGKPSTDTFAMLFLLFLSFFLSWPWLFNFRV